MINKIKKINSWLQKKYKFGLVTNYPFRTSTQIAKDYFGKKEIIVAEIGTFKGENALNILQQLNVKKIYLIDPYSDYAQYKKDVSSKNVDRNLKSAKKRLKKYSDKIIWIRKFSHEAINEIKRKVDFVYVDGNHDYDYVKQDMENYWKLIKRRGIMAGHDVPYDSVLKAFCEFVHKHRVEPHIWNMDWWIFKPK